MNAAAVALRTREYFVDIDLSLDVDSLLTVGIPHDRNGYDLIFGNCVFEYSAMAALAQRPPHDP